MTDQQVLMAFMMGTAKTLSSTENIQVVNFMEQQVLKIAKEKGFKAIVTTNTNALTLQIDQTILGYTTLKEFPINRYVDRFGRRPFEEAEDDQKTVTMWKDIED